MFRNRYLRTRAGPQVPCGPSGFSLLEVILAMAILVGSLAVLSQLIDLGARNAVAARMQTEAILRCESKMQEIVAGILPPEPVSPVPFEDDPNWQWSVEVDSDLSEGLLAISVTVEEAGSQSESPISFRLHRWLRDPEMLEAMLDEEAAEGSGP